jgi:purine-binding chemotaxis protein CheW
MAVGTRSSSFKLVTFMMGKEKFGIEILTVQEIVREVRVTRVPKAPDFVEGVINLRGRVIPIVDLRKRFDIKFTPSESTRVVIIALKNITVGLVVDGVDKVMDIDHSAIDDTPSIVFGIDSGFITGVAKVNDELIMILDLNKVFSFEEQGFLQNV